MRSERVTFPNAEGHLLAGRLDLPLIGTPIAYALYAHCFTCTKDLRAIGRITETLALHGIATLRFDFAGLGAEPGRVRRHQLLVEHRRLPSGLPLPGGGLRRPRSGDRSFPRRSRRPGRGSRTPLRPGRRDDRRAGEPGTHHPAHRRRRGSHPIGRRSRGAAGGSPVHDSSALPRRHFVGAARRCRSPALERPLLVLHSPIDTTVGVDNAAEIFQTGPTPEEFRLPRHRRPPHLRRRRRPIRRRGDRFVGQSLHHRRPGLPRPARLSPSTRQRA